MAGGLVRNSLLSAIAGGFTSLGGFLSMVIVARTLGVAETGSVAYAIWLATMAVAVFDLGAHATLARHLPQVAIEQGAARAEGLASGLFRPYGLAIALAVVGACAYVLSPIGAQQGAERQTLVLLVVALCALQVLANFTLGYFRGMQRFGTSAQLTIFSLALQVACVFVGARLFGVDGALAGYCVGSAPMALFALRWTFARRASTDLVEARMIRFAAFAWAGALAAAFVWSRAEIFFLQRSWGSGAVGLFSVGLTFSNMAAQGPLLLTGALLAFFSERAGASSKDVVNNAFASGTRILAFIAFPLCFGTAAVLPALLPLLYGQAFEPAVVPGMIVVAAAAFAATGAVGTHMMFARDRSDFIFYSNVLGAVLSIAAGLTIIPAYGLVGAALVRAIIHVVLVSFGGWFLSARLACPVPWGPLGRLVIAAALCATAAHGVLVLVSGPAGLPCAIAAGALVYWGAVRTLRALPREDIERLRQIGARLPRSLQWAPDRALRLLTRPERALGMSD